MKISLLAKMLKWLEDEPLFSKDDYIELMTNAGRVNETVRDMKIVTLLREGISYKLARTILTEGMNLFAKCGIKVQTA